MCDNTLLQGMLNEAYTLFSEAFLILQQVRYQIRCPSVNPYILIALALIIHELQVTGPMHREVANCCR